jgi:hypothetical protein
LDNGIRLARLNARCPDKPHPLSWAGCERY